MAEMKSTEFDEIWERVKSRTKIKQFKELAEEVGTIATSISRKRKNNDFPTDWAFHIAQKYNLSTDWVLTGREQKIPKRGVKDSYLDMMEQWLNEYTAPDPRKRAMFELTVEKEFPEFREWMRKKAEENEHSVQKRVA